MCFIWGGIGSGDNVREYLCLTSDGVHILTQQPLHNHLADLLRRGDPARIDAFFQRFTPEEACVQCLTLITETAAPAEYAHLLSARARERERRKERARVCQRDGESLPACERDLSLYISVVLCGAVVMPGRPTMQRPWRSRPLVRTHTQTQAHARTAASVEPILADWCMYVYVRLCLCVLV
jgi:hypothetical protein